jgi:hypothetical protein
MCSVETVVNKQKSISEVVNGAKEKASITFLLFSQNQYKQRFQIEAYATKNRQGQGFERVFYA